MLRVVGDRLQLMPCMTFGNLLAGIGACFYLKCNVDQRSMASQCVRDKQHHQIGDQEVSLPADACTPAPQPTAVSQIGLHSFERCSASAASLLHGAQC
jgi:hypothetical protein